MEKIINATKIFAILSLPILLGCYGSSPSSCLIIRYPLRWLVKLLAFLFHLQFVSVGKMSCTSFPQHSIVKHEAHALYVLVLIRTP